MRTFFLLIAFLLSCAAFGSTYEMRSDKYALSVSVRETRDVDVRVTDAGTGAVLLARSFPYEGPMQSASLQAGNQTVTVEISTVSGQLTASVQVVEDRKPVDSMRGTWMLPVANEVIAGPLRVGGDVKAPVVVQRVNPKYTEEARLNRIAGIVILEVVIDRTGAVTDAQVLKTLPYGLGEAAAEAVRQWKFKPGTLNGVPVDVIFNLTVNFKPESE